MCSERSQNVLELVEEFNRAVPLLPQDDPGQRHVPWFLRFAASPRMALVFGPLGGLCIYLFLALMVLNGLPLTALVGNHNSTIPIEPLLGRFNGSEGPVGSFSSLIRKASAAITDTDGKTIVWTDETITHVVACGIGLVSGELLTVGGYKSSRVRATMLLVVPTIMSKRGHAFMLTSAFGILLAGPVHTIELNVQEVVRSLTCLYEQMKMMAEDSLQQAEDNFDKVHEAMKNIYDAIDKQNKNIKQRIESAFDATEDEMNEIKEHIELTMAEFKKQQEKVKKFLSKVSKGCGSVLAVMTFTYKSDCKIVKVPRPPEFNISLPSMSFDLNPRELIGFDHHARNELHAMPIKEIRERLKGILGDVFRTIELYFKYMSKLCYLSFIFMIGDAAYYMYKYYTDDSFDNLFVDHNLRNYARIVEDRGLLPLRNWELRERYQNQTALSLSKKELKRIIIQAISSIIFTFFVIGVVVADFVFRSVLEVFRKEARFGLQYEGMEQGVSLSTLGKTRETKLTIKMFNLSSEPCLPSPHSSDYTRLLAIALLILVCFLSCVFDAYASRLRSTICNACFPRRAAERAAFLYRRITTGRGTRRLQLQMISYRRLEKKQREANFFGRNKQAAGGVSAGRKCVGCDIKIRKVEATKFPVKFFGQSATVHICRDCKKDTSLN